MWRDRSLFDFHKWWERDKDTDLDFSKSSGEKENFQRHTKFAERIMA